RRHLDALAAVRSAQDRERALVVSDAVVEAAGVLAQHAEAVQDRAGLGVGRAEAALGQRERAVQRLARLRVAGLAPEHVAAGAQELDPEGDLFLIADPLEQLGGLEEVLGRAAEVAALVAVGRALEQDRREVRVARAAGGQDALARTLDEIEGA